MPQAVVFDCDGLLMDTEPCWTVAETALFARHGLPFGPAQKALVIGKSLEAAADTMAEVFGRPGTGPGRELGSKSVKTISVQGLDDVSGKVTTADGRSRPAASARADNTDSMTGVRSARAAGVPVIGVPTLPNPDFPADVVVESLQDTDLLSWPARWPR